MKINNKKIEKSSTQSTHAFESSICFNFWPKLVKICAVLKVLKVLKWQGYRISYS